MDGIFKRFYCSKSDDKQQVLSKKDQLKIAFRDYGSTIVTFHVAISLVSLGSFYLLISKYERNYLIFLKSVLINYLSFTFSGIDVIAQLDKLGYAPEALKNNVAVGASNFVIAYAIHKIFAPIRISLTLGMAPFIVRYLRSKGLLKPKNVNK